ncbi:tetraacyldisaccharide 4'-kinase [Dysgonomonas sp. Marseille-P4361]|uniref:tetraacyldisaccharide 4'-kinase n=1 Tax=Dysgonomonas sp. Marseille-P4361 TaxID=2161820 RepID=UPI000D54BB73|nr:tetraacyldisaccharide 4'-kinase [Dysgonomonas sp. Marseille-P4361]
MIRTEPVRISKWLLPFSWLYGFVVYIRNKFFDWGLLKHEEFEVPVICVGNITVGGTGKTPHTEYLVRLLSKQYRVAVLSRGYKRSSKGFVLATDSSTSAMIGDESFQIKKKYPDTIVAVDADRRRGIRKLLALENPPEIILLDDAFQHRYVKPSYTIILSDYNRPVYEDRLLPAGRLREPFSSMRNANMIIVTKCPDDLQPIDFRIISHDINVFPYQGLYFTSFTYKNIEPVFSGANQSDSLAALRNKHILLVTGIASPKALLKELSKYTEKIDTLTYPDHHNFGSKDIKHITNTFRGIKSEDKLILVTEKDAARFVSRDDIDEDLRQRLFYIPIEVTFVGEARDFDEKIYKHVRENIRNRRLLKK